MPDIRHDPTGEQFHLSSADGRVTAHLTQVGAHHYPGVFAAPSSFTRSRRTRLRAPWVPLSPSR